MMKTHSNSRKRKSALISDGHPFSFKRRSRMGNYVDSLERKEPEDKFTREEKYNEDEDNNDVRDDTDDENAGDNDAVEDHQEEAEYIPGDDGPNATEEQHHKGLLTKDADEKNMPSTRDFIHGYHLIQGLMNHGMEDYIFAQHRNLNGYDLGLYAIFDGHSGHEVAKYLQSHLFENILSEPDFWENPVYAVKKACKAIDDEILENIADSRGGSTAVAAILINGVKLLVANVGDSRAVSCKNGRAKPLTVDHEPEKEKDLIESRGGFVSKKPGNVPRVDGQLAMTRAFGDGKLKEHITAEPDVTIRNIDDDTEFIILASDGLWKEACDCIRDADDAQKASKKLIKEAKSMGSYDDISCIVIMF
ncbi:probable protein phosphatase 2C 39 isoform X2 [Cajanus cajan]|uniref:probable protein phosphatase 2C 39 isoform X2 n=1 Tax=Cajanus cajan TaxID=3821 RepID=UPI0010FB6231|nr:probable protein phosphatase 2C 39 isoform X2 [Cajanus cajan]